MRAHVQGSRDQSCLVTLICHTLSVFMARSTGPLGEFEQITLLALLRLEPEAYGASIQREIEARTGRAVLLGAVYTTLDRLERKGLVVSWMGAPTAERGGRRK